MRQLQVASYGLPATVTVTGGAIHQGVDADGPVTVEIKGGEISGNLYAKQTSTIRVFGSGFAVNGVPVDPGELEAMNGMLTGTLDSDDALSVNFQQGYPSGEYTGTIELVPEPVLALMQGLALLSVAVIRSRRRARR
jgi:hypothetical protein